MKNLLTATNVASVAVVSAALLLLAPTSASFAGSSYGALAVNSSEVINGYAQAGGDYSNGFKFKMNLTLPSNENQVSLKFSDWSHSGTGTAIATSGNMQVGLTNALGTNVANAYGSSLIAADTNTGALGTQVDVYIGLKVPAGAAAGTYSTTYGVKTQPVALP